MIKSNLQHPYLTRFFQFGLDKEPRFFSFAIELDIYVFFSFSSLALVVKA